VVNRPIHGGNLVWASALAGCPPEAILDFSASINPLGPPESALAAIARGLEFLSAYPDPHYSQLRSALARSHNLDPDWILPGNGAAELLTWACRELAMRSQTYVVTPAFSDYERALSAFGANVVRFPLSVTDSGPTPFPIPLPTSANSRSPGLLLNNPHNPTGKLWTMETILPNLDKFDPLVIDEAFMDFLPPAEQQSAIAMVEHHDNLVVLRSLTKFYSLPGLRLGYAIAHPDRLQRWQNWRDPWPVNVLAAAAGVAVLQDTAFQQQTWDWLGTAKPELYGALQSVDGLEPEWGAANFLLVRTAESSSQLQERLLRENQIFIRDCLSFPELGDRYFRIAIRTSAENQRLLEALQQHREQHRPDARTMTPDWGRKNQ
jgi:L-threonine-O-3-phosphate decarboxylase